jgi:hypothetical protein
MKSIKLIYQTVFIITLFLTSCSLEKRIYNQGYHVDHLGGKHKQNKQNYATNDEYKHPISAAFPVTKTTEELALSDLPPSPIGEDFITSTDDEQIVLSPKGTTHEINFISEEKKAKSMRFIKKQKRREVFQLTNDDEYSTAAIIGFSCSIVGLILLFTVGFPFLLGVMGIIFSSVGLKKTRQDGKRGKAFAVIGLIIGILDVLLFLLLVLFAIWLVSVFVLGI